MADIREEKLWEGIAELADNIDVCPLVDGAISMTVGFYGLLDRTSGGEHEQH